MTNALGRLSVWDDALITGATERFHRLYSELLSLSPRAADMLESLKARGLRLGVITNGHSVAQREKIERFGLARHFAYIGIEGELGFGKPQPRAYQCAMRALAAEPESTWMVGDSLDLDVVAPRRLGMRAVWVDHAGRGLPAHVAVRPDHVVQAVAELI